MGPSDPEAADIPVCHRAFLAVLFLFLYNI